MTKTLLLLLYVLFIFSCKEKNKKVSIGPKEDSVTWVHFYPKSYNMTTILEDGHMYPNKHIVKGLMLKGTKKWVQKLYVVETLPKEAFIIIAGVDEHRKYDPIYYYTLLDGKPIPDDTFVIQTQNINQ